MCEYPHAFQCIACTTASCGHGHFRAPCGPTADTGCSACAAHTYGELTRTTTCVETCAIGQRVNDAKSGCVMCDAGKISAAAAATCTDCPTNSWTGSGRAACFCNPGYEDVSGTCTLCAVGQTSVSGDTCQDCGAGQTDNGDRTGCVSCSIGFYSPVRSVCLPCEKGKISATPFVECVFCDDFMTSDGTGGMCFVPSCPAGQFAPVDNVAVAMHWDHFCEPCPYNSISQTGQTFCVQCGAGKFANDDKTECLPCGDAQFDLVLPWNSRGISVESDDESSERWAWILAGDLLSVRTPCMCASGRLSPLESLATAGVVNEGSQDAAQAISSCRACVLGRLNHPLLLTLPSKSSQLYYGDTAPVPFDASLHFQADNLCEECQAGSHYFQKEGGVGFQCLPCKPGTVQPRAGQPACLPCLMGQYADESGLSQCILCALCPEGQFRRGCGRAPRTDPGICETCLLRCEEGSMPTACINRLGVSADPPACKRKEFLTRTPLCQSNRNGDTMDRGLGLGGFDFETIFGASELEVPFQCSRVCDARGGPIDTMTCDGPYACNRMTCTMESSYLDTDLNDFRVARACPVELSSAETSQPLANVDMLRRKRQVACQRCSECGAIPLAGVRGLHDWGRGCVRECSLVECLQNEVYDWTDHKCKRCDQLANVSLCTHEQSQSAQLATQDVSGNRPKLRFQGCRAKLNPQEEPLTYGACESCRGDAHDCSGLPGPAAFHAGCESGCQPCRHKQNLVLTSARRFVTEEGRVEPLYCQVSECTPLPPDNTPKTGLKDMGSMCERTCDASPCEDGTVRLECSLPHDTRCVPVHPLLAPGQSRQGIVPAHANLLEHPDSARYHFSNFENALVNVDGAAQDLHQCVWNAVDVRDNDMNPAGVSFTFFPPARTYAFGLDEYGSKFCHRWMRDPQLVYPLLPLQNTVSFASDFPRRVLLNASARVQHYAYSGDGHSEVATVAEMPRPVLFPDVYAGDLYLNVDLHRTSNASVSVFVPDDRDMDTAAWIPSLVFSALVADSTAPSTVARPALDVETVWVSRSPPGIVKVSLRLNTVHSVFKLAAFEGVHCEPQLCRFAVLASHTAAGGSVWVSSNNVSQPDYPLTRTFADMTLASPRVAGLSVVRRQFPLKLPSSSVAQYTSQNFTQLAVNERASSCHVLLVVDKKSLACLQLGSSPAHGTVTPVNLGATRLELLSLVVGLAMCGPDSLILLELSADFGQQLLLHSHDLAITRNVQFSTPDVVAIACDPATDDVWLLRRVRTTAALQFTIVRTTLFGARDASLLLRLEASTTSFTNMLASIFTDNPSLALSDEDTHAMSVFPGTASRKLFVAFAFVPAQHRYLVLLQDSGEIIEQQCSLLSEYPGLEATITSVAWTSESSLVLRLQNNIYTAQCDGAALELRHVPVASIPNTPFVLYGSSYISLLTPRLVELSSNMLGADLALEPNAAGFCVFVSAPRTDVSVIRLQNAYLGDRTVVLDAFFDTGQLLQHSALGFLDAVDSLRVLGTVPNAVAEASVHVVVNLQPTAQLPQHPLYAHMARAILLGAARSSFWNTAHTHLVEAQLSLPCAAYATLALNDASSTRLQARASASGQCGSACAVLHLTLVESWDASFAPSWHIAGGTAYVKDDIGSRASPVAALTELRLFEGARLSRVHAVAFFSSVQFACAHVEQVGSSHQWQRLRTVTSAHSMLAKQGLAVRVSRAARGGESWTVPRSLALDALQVLVVLTSGVAFPLQATGVSVVASRQPSDVSAWIAHVHCCGPTTDLYLSVCPLDDGFYVLNTQHQCAMLAQVGTRQCAARSYVVARGSCHCHSTCSPQNMRITSQTGVALMLGKPVNFCPADQFPRDLSSADTSPANCGPASGTGSDETVASGAVITTGTSAIAFVDAVSIFFVPMYVPTRAELSLIDLQGVMFGENNVHTDNWQRVFVLVTLETRIFAAEKAACEYRIRLAGLSAAHGVLARSAHSRLHELGCTVRLDARGVGECHLEVPTSLAMLTSHRRVALIAEVAGVTEASAAASERLRCEWPERDLFTASLVPYMSMNTCEHEQFWSEDARECVSCQLANNEIVNNVCGPGAYIRGCDAVSHLDSSVVAECQRCVNADHNADGSYEWLAGICQWQCALNFYLHATARCEPCTESLRQVCGVTAGQRWQQCSRDTNEQCAPCPPVLRGVYSANEMFVGAQPGGAECQTVCRPGHYRLLDSCRVCASIPNLQLQLDFQHGSTRNFYRFQECAGALDTLPVLCTSLPNGDYTGDANTTGTSCAFECHAGFHAILGQCVSCAVPRGRNGAALVAAAFAFVSTACDYECRADNKYVMRDGSCTLCDASSCASGLYLAGATCTECRPCVRMALQNGLFISHGELDAPASCAEQCAPGFFADFELCVAHSVLTCDAGEYQLPGTAVSDVMCLPCQDCHGRRLVDACTPSRNAICAACPPLGVNEEYTDTQCSNRCVSGALRDAAGACELCATECVPGTFRDYASSASCAHCETCPPLHNNSLFVDECTWACAVGFTLHANTSRCEAEVSSMAPRDEPLTIRVQCSESEFRVGEFECRPCTELGVVLPAAEGFNVRWRWSRWAERGAGLCEFECLTPYLLFLGTDGSKICYTSEEYTAHVRLLHSELFPEEVPVQKPDMISRAVHNITESISRDFPKAYMVEIVVVSSVVGAVLVLAVLF